MVAPFSTVGGYGGNASLATLPSGQSAFLEDMMDGFPTLHPQIGAGGALTSISIDPSSSSYPPGVSYPQMNAILAELRVLAGLLHMQMGPSAPDLQIMRADEALSTNPTLGVL